MPMNAITYCKEYKFKKDETFEFYFLSSVNFGKQNYDVSRNRK